MKPPRLQLVLLPVALLAFLASRSWAAPASDLVSPERRRPTVELAERLAKPPLPAPLGADLVQPFNPAAFGQPDPEELRAIAAAQAAAAAASAPSKPSTDSDFLRAIAARVMPSGTLILGGEPRLIFGKKRLRVGDQLTVSYDGQDYNLELTAIDRTTFTLRLNKDEITRPIKPPKTP
jgi:hypothetical protein